MAAPNIVNVTAIYGKTVDVAPANTSANVVLSNSASSGKVFKINTIIATNIDNTNSYTATVARNSAADGSGNSKPLINAITVPVNAAVIVTDKSTSFYLQENESIVVTSGANNKIQFTVSYEEIS